MAQTIDNLNFKVILDDEKFDEKINQDIELAKKLNVQLSALLNVKSRISNTKMVGDATKAAKFQKATADAAAAQERLKTASTNTAAAQERLAAAAANAANAQERLKQSQMRTEQLTKRITSQTERQNKAYAQQSRILNELKGLALGYLSIHGAGQLLSSLVRVTGEFELQKTTLAAMLGDLNSAEQIITRIQGLAVESPFQFKELTTYAKQLSAFSVPAQELYDTTKMLADVSAGLGVGMDRIVLAYGQVRSAAFLRGQEVRQFTEAGIPILNELAKQFSELRGTAVSTAEVFDLISKRMVPFEMVAKVFKDMTSEGGKFFNMQEVQAETLRGKISNLKDAYEVMLNEIGKGQSENLKGAVDWAKKLMVNYEETGRALVELVAAYGVYKVALLTLTVATNNFALANSKLYTSIINATKWAIKNPYVVLAAGITAAGYAIYKNITALEGYEKVHKSFLDTEKKYSAALASEEVKLDTLYASLKLAKEGTEEYEKARKSLYTQYASYISDLKDEGVEVSNLATLYDSLKIKVQEYTNAKFRSLAQTDLDQTFEQEVSLVRDRYKTLVAQIENIRKNAGESPLSADDKVGLWQYITGDIATLWDMAEKPELNRIKSILSKKLLPFGDIAKELQGDLKDIKDTYASDMQAIINLYGETSEDLAENDPFKIPLGGDEDGKSPAQKAIEEQIRSVQKLQDAYEKLLPYLNEVQMKSTLKSLFPNISEGVIDSLDFHAELERLADELAEFDKDAANRLRDTIGTGVTDEIVNSFKAVEKYKKRMDSWLGEDFNLSGTGIGFDISKILSDLNSVYAGIDQKRKESLDLLHKAQLGDEKALALVRETYGEEVWQKYVTEGSKAIDELAEKQRNSERKLAQERLNNLAEAYVGDMTEKLDLSDWGDKSLGQIEYIRSELLKLMNSDIPISDSLRKELELLELNTDDLIAKIKELFGGKFDTATIEKIKAVQDAAKGVSSYSQKVGESLATLGESMNSDFLKGAAKAVSLLGNMADAIMESESLMAKLTLEFGDVSNLSKEATENLENIAKSSDWITVVIKVILSAVTAVSNVIATQRKNMELAVDAVIAYKNALSEIQRENADTIFGSSQVNILVENLNAASEAYRFFKKELDDVMSQDRGKGGWYLPSIGGEGGEGYWFDTYRDLRSLLKNDTFKSEKEMMEYLKANIDYWESLTHFSDGERTTSQLETEIRNLIKAYEAWDEANKEVKASMTELFGQLGNDIASNMINSFLEVGKATANLEESFESLGETVLHSFLKTAIIDDFLMPRLETISDLMTQAAFEEISLDELATQLGNITGAIKSDLAEMGPIWEEIFASFQENGLLPDSESSAADLGSGIKGITEDTANLLASYLNAIRADVSYSKTLWVRMDANLQRIADIFASSPTLMEYQAQIAANTYNTSIATQEILSELRSVITTEGDGTSIRVYS